MRQGSLIAKRLCSKNGRVGIELDEDSCRRDGRFNSPSQVASAVSGKQLPFRDYILVSAS